MAIMKTVFYPDIMINAHIILNGGVVAYPTEAVWGLGCDPFNEEAVNAILSLKQRHVSKGLILVASSMEQFTPFLTDISDTQRQQLEDSWPGPFTWLVPNNGSIPKWVSGKHRSVALRVSNHPYVKALCDAVGGPIVSTSANPQGRPAPTHAWQVHHYFHHHRLLDNIAKAQVGSSTKPSTITDLESGKVIR